MHKLDSMKDLVVGKHYGSRKCVLKMFGTEKASRGDPIILIQEDTRKKLGLPENSALWFFHFPVYSMGDDIRLNALLDKDGACIPMEDIVAPRDCERYTKLEDVGYIRMRLKAIRQTDSDKHHKDWPRLAFGVFGKGSKPRTYIGKFGGDPNAEGERFDDVFREWKFPKI